jgi:beta-N-acetylhexosaminidase
VNRLKTKYGFPESKTAKYLGQYDPDSTRYYAELTAGTLAMMGFNVNFAPVVDLASNPDNPVINGAERAYSADPEKVAAYAEQVIIAHNKNNIGTALKHFPGHGSSMADTHFGMADVTNLWNENELLPYKILIEKGLVNGVMSSHIVHKGLDEEGYPGTLSYKIISELLRSKLNYDGVVYTDDMQMQAITKHYGLEEAVYRAINAGVDMMIFSNNIQGSENRTLDTVHSLIRNMITDGRISEERIDESYHRIMDLKSTLKLQE